MFTDPFAGASNSITSPAADCFAIVPDDAAELPRATKALYVGTGGDVTVRLVEADADVTFRNVVGGTILDLRLRAVRSTGTTAADLVGLV